MRKKNHLAIFIGLLLFAVEVVRAQTDTLTFQPKRGIVAKITISGQEVVYAAIKGHSKNVGQLTVETENPLRVHVADYNFDGYDDFAVSHVADGMGTYMYYYIYKYSPRANKFYAMKPPCSYEFINVVLDPKSRTLSNSYFANNVLLTCKKKY